MTRESVLLLLATVGGAISIGVYGVDFNLYVVALQLSNAALGVILGASGVGLALGIIPAVMLADGWGRKRTLILGGILSGPPAMAQCLVSSTPLLTLSGAIAGMGGAAIAVVGLPMLLESSRPTHRTFVLAAAGALGVVGSAGGSILGGWLPTIMAQALTRPTTGPDGYRVVLLASLAVGALMSIPLLFWYRDSFVPQRTTLAVSAWRDAAWRQLAWRTTLVLGTVSFGAGLAIPYLNLYFTRDLGLSTQAFGILSAASQVCLGLASLLTTALVPRLTVSRAVAVTQAASLPFLALLAVAPGPLLAAPAYIVRQSLMDMTATVAQGWLVGLASQRYRALTASLVLLSANLPWSISSAFGGWLAGRVGYRPGLLLTVACYALASLFWLVLFAPSDKESNKENGAWVHLSTVFPTEKSDINL